MGCSAGAVSAARCTPPDSETRSRTPIDRLISRRDIHLREKTLRRILYETCARADELLQLNIEDLDLAGRCARVKSKGAKPRRPAVPSRPFPELLASTAHCRPTNRWICPRTTTDCPAVLDPGRFPCIIRRTSRLTHCGTNWLVSGASWRSCTPTSINIRSCRCKSSARPLHSQID
nr:site-specific integrase [Nocardia albiluteola]